MTKTFVEKDFIAYGIHYEYAFIIIKDNDKYIQVETDCSTEIFSKNAVRIFDTVEELIDTIVWTDTKIEFIKDKELKQKVINRKNEPTKSNI